MRDARCDPRPASPPRVIVGGGSRRILTVAAEQADTVGVNTSLASGEKGGDLASQATFDHYDRCLAWVREGAGDRFNSIELQIVGLRHQSRRQPPRCRAHRNHARLSG